MTKTRTVYSPSTWPHGFHAGPRHTAVMQWLTANGIDPADVPLDHPVTIETVDDRQVIRHRALLRNGNGRPYLDPQTDNAAMEERTAALVVEPPEEWPADALPGSA